jgi:hypothetical protein
MAENAQRPGFRERIRTFLYHFRIRGGFYWMYVFGGIMGSLLLQPLWNKWLATTHLLVLLIFAVSGLYFTTVGRTCRRIQSPWARWLLIKISGVAVSGWLAPAFVMDKYGYAYCVWRQTKESSREWGVRFVRYHVCYPKLESARMSRYSVLITKYDGHRTPYLCLMPKPCQVRETEAEAERDAMVFVMDWGNAEGWPP